MLWYAYIITPSQYLNAKYDSQRSNERKQHLSLFLDILWKPHFKSVAGFISKISQLTDLESPVFLLDTRTNRSGTYLQCSPSLTKPWMENSWSKGFWTTLNVPSIYHSFAVDNSFSIVSVTNRIWRWPCCLTSACMKPWGMLSVDTYMKIINVWRLYYAIVVIVEGSQHNGQLEGAVRVREWVSRVSHHGSSSNHHLKVKAGWIFWSKPLSASAHPASQSLETWYSGQIGVCLCIIYHLGKTLPAIVPALWNISSLPSSLLYKQHHTPITDWAAQFCES